MASSGQKPTKEKEQIKQAYNTSFSTYLKQSLHVAWDKLQQVAMPLVGVSE